MRVSLQHKIINSVILQKMRGSTACLLHDDSHDSAPPQVDAEKAGDAVVRFILIRVGIAGCYGKRASRNTDQDGIGS